MGEVFLAEHQRIERRAAIKVLMPERTREAHTVRRADDQVDGSVAVTCDHPSGSLFSLGTTVVTCTATDRHGNTGSPARFSVQVKDTLPPLLHLPAPTPTIATSAQGAVVTYVAAATDGADPAPQVSCAPASASRFPLGTTAVTCTGTDRSGNRAQESFTQLVTVSWSNLLAPIDLLGLAAFLRGLPVAVQFSLTGPSAGITNLGARLFVAPVDSAGRVGSERPAVALAPGVANLFRFVPLLNQYLLSLNTGGLGAGIWQLRVDLGDGLRTPRVSGCSDGALFPEC